MPDRILAPAYTLRPATVGDRDVLYDLHAACLKKYVAATWGWDDATQRAMFEANFAPERSRIVMVDDRIVGIIAVERRAADWFIGNIAIDPVMQGQGLGSALLCAILAGAAREAIPVRLQVLRVNPARHLYERLGFVVEGETPTHFQMIARVAAAEEGGAR